MGDKSVRTTVVGGRALKGDNTHTIAISGIERVLKFAAGNRDFRENLFERRSEAATEFGIDLTPLDAQIIDEVPENQLRSLIKAIVTRYRQAPIFTGLGS